jgi:membrane protein YdbS with pleckstrin-like domain
MWQWFMGIVQEVCVIPPQRRAPGDDRAKIVRPSPGYWRYRMLTWVLGRAVILLTFAAPIAAAELAGSQLPTAAHILLRVVEGTGAALWLLSLPIGYALQRLDYENRWYVITDHSVRIREGIVIIHEMTLTFANVQNVTIDQGPLQRTFGIADLRVQTAGGGGGHEQPGMRSMHTGILRGLDDAERLRETVLARLRVGTDAGLGDPDDAQSGHGLDAAATALLAEARALANAAERLTPSVDSRS